MAVIMSTNGEVGDLKRTLLITILIIFQININVQTKND